MLPEELKYTEEHEWVLLEDSIATIGVTEHASKELGEIVFVELPKIDKTVAQTDELGTVESVKTVSSLYSPMTGTVTETNLELENEPNLINDSPYGNGWIVKLSVEDTNEYGDLMTFEEYETYLENL